MFIVTAKIPRRRLLASAITVFCCCLVIATALIVTLGDRAVTTSAEATGVKSNEDRIAYLNQLGWIVEETPLSVEELLVPETFDASYDEYLAFLRAQGFDLANYAGKRIKRYTYQVTNYADSAADVQATLLVYRNKVIGGQLQAADGSFVLPLTGG